jgi:hypothetical protein
LNFKELLENCGPPTVPHEIQATVASVVDTAHDTRQKLAEFQQELGRTRGRLSAVKQLVGMIDDGSAARRDA